MEEKEQREIMAERLSAWLKSRPWYAEWFDNLCRCYPEPEDYGIVQSFVRGREGEYTIEQAFNWRGSAEGLAFWTRANADLKEFINTLTE